MTLSFKAFYEICDAVMEICKVDNATAMEVAEAVNLKIMSDEDALISDEEALDQIGMITEAFENIFLKN